MRKLKIRCHSQYDHFPNHRAEPGEPALELWNDGKIWEYLQTDQGNRCEGSALMIEPRSLQEENYRFLENNYWRFRHIFTHDSGLLAICPNALPIIYWNAYELNDEPKTKNISMICGTKMMCPLHKERIRMADELDDEIDILGDIYGGDKVSTHDAYAPYRFSVVIENHYDDIWLTEKVLNAFANKTIPIYFGARDIGHLFRTDGIIRVRNLWNIPGIIKELKGHEVEEYESRLDAIEDNFRLVQNYKDFEDYFTSKYVYVIEEESGWN